MSVPNLFAFGLIDLVLDITLQSVVAVLYAVRTSESVCKSYLGWQIQVEAHNF